MTEPLDLTALGLARAIRRRELSSEDTAELFLERIERLNPQVGAFVHLFRKRAVRQARACDRALASSGGGARGVFYGVPIGVKDLDPVRMSPVRMGSRAYRYLWSPMDGPVARRVRRGGFVILGKLATSELALMPVTETDIHPPCRSPWDLEHSAGGSSGGSGAAVAARLLPIAQSSDGAGSTRIPATLAGLFGLKPSRGLLPNVYGRMDPFEISTISGITRDVEDSAALLDALTGLRYDPEAPPDGSLLVRARGEVPRLRIRWTSASPLAALPPVVEEAVRRAAELLADMGHDVSEGAPTPGPYDDFIAVYGHVAAGPPVLRESSLQPVSRWLRTEGRRHSRAAMAARAGQIADTVSEWWGDADVWLTPATGALAPRVGEWADLEPSEAFRRATPLGAFTAMFNLGGQPAAAIPAGLSPEGLPFSIQVAARHGEDGMLLALCKALERAMPWRQRRPAGFE